MNRIEETIFRLKIAKEVAYLSVFYTNDKLSELTGIPFQSISQVKHGHSLPNIELAQEVDVKIRCIPEWKKFSFIAETRESGIVSKNDEHMFKIKIIKEIEYLLKHYSIEELSDLLKTSTHRINNYLTGENIPTMTTAQELSRSLYLIPERASVYCYLSDGIEKSDEELNNKTDNIIREITDEVFLLEHNINDVKRKISQLEDLLLNARASA
jgi:transcriptional regulator with XRE-family HTH domain